MMDPQAPSTIEPSVDGPAFISMKELPSDTIEMIVDAFENDDFWFSCALSTSAFMDAVDFLLGSVINFSRDATHDSGLHSSASVAAPVPSFFRKSALKIQF
jgi:hypothetical protein